MKDDVKQALADRDFWRDLGNRYGWRLVGFTYRHSATFADERGNYFDVGPQILAALNGRIEE